MPTLDQHQSQNRTKLLLLGNSGSGKTRALSTLANAGYRLFILDYDGGLDILRSSVKPENLKNVHYETLTDTPGLAPSAHARGASLISEWKETIDGKVVSLGKPSTWGPKDVFVVDSLSMQGTAALQYALFIGGHAGRAPQIQHWGEAMRLQETLLQMLWSETTKCNVVIIAHLTFIGGEESHGVMKGYPSALGNKLPPKIGRYFNSVLLVDVQGDKRTLRTSSWGNIDLKTPVPMPPTMEVDLSKYFDLVQNYTPPQT